MAGTGRAAPSKPGRGQSQPPRDSLARRARGRPFGLGHQARPRATLGMGRHAGAAHPNSRRKGTHRANEEPLILDSSTTGYDDRTQHVQLTHSIRARTPWLYALTRA